MLLGSTAAGTAGRTVQDAEPTFRVELTGSAAGSAGPRARPGPLKSASTASGASARHRRKYSDIYSRSATSQIGGDETDRPSLADASLLN